MDYGLNHFAFGARVDIPDPVILTLNYWLQALMACFPDDPNGHCPAGQGGGSLSELFRANFVGTGKECGYVQFPPLPKDDNLHPGIIAAIAITPVIVMLALAVAYHVHRLRVQEQRMKRRFIQQLARNIEIGESARAIPAEKLLEAYKHIGGDDGVISKVDLAQWLNDLHMDFMSERDFDRLWGAMDMEGKGTVDTIDFTTFLAECSPQFKQVQKEYEEMPVSERRKLACRRLTNISDMGEEEVRQMERRNNRRSRAPINTGNSSIKLDVQDHQRLHARGSILESVRNLFHQDSYS